MAMALRFASFQTPAVTRDELAQLRTELAAIGHGFENAPLDSPALTDSRGRQDFLHFWLYSLVVSPGLWLARAFGLHPNWAFTMVNAALLTAAAAIAARHVPLIAVLVVFVSPIVWWVDKAHSEVFLFACLGIAAALSGAAPGAALLAYAVAGAQNVAIGATWPVFAVATYWARLQEHATKVPEVTTSATRHLAPGRRHWCVLAVAASIVLLPFAYYTVRLGTASPMVGFAEWRALSPRGMIAFLIEPNIGLVVAAPAWAAVVIGVIALQRGGGRNVSLWWPVIVQLLLLAIWATNPSANHGGTPGVNRWVLSLLPLSIPWLSHGHAVTPRSLRRALLPVVIVGACLSVGWHLPRWPESYVTPTALATQVWKFGYVDVTPAETFAERVSGREPPTLPVHQASCEVVLMVGAQWPITCVPPAIALPPTCRAFDAMCYVVSDRRVVPAVNNGFIFRLVSTSWLAEGPLAAGVRRLMLELAPGVSEWAIGDLGLVGEVARDARPLAVLQHGNVAFAYIPQTGAEAKLAIRAPSGARVSVVQLTPFARLQETYAGDGETVVRLPRASSNIAVVVQGLK